MSELHSPAIVSRQVKLGLVGANVVGANVVGVGNGNVPGEGFFHDLNVLNHSATQDINALKEISSDYFDAAA